MMAPKHTIPQFLEDIVSPAAYEKWLERRARAHVQRDRNRSYAASQTVYKEAIHAAVLLSLGKDFYTGEMLRWDLISTYKNEDSKSGRYKYKSRFALLPTVDHFAVGATEASFRICAWRTNDAKNDSSHEDFVDLCRKVLVHNGYTVTKFE